MVNLKTGDFTMTGTKDEVIEFNNWLKKQDFKYKVVISGNHEHTFEPAHYETMKHLMEYEEDPNVAKACLKDCIYLEDSSVELFGYKIYGSPWTPAYCCSAFSAKRGEEIRSKWNKIPDDTDILMTHGPPYGIRDIAAKHGKHVGCEDLRKTVQERVKPLIHVFGHIHESYGTYYDGTTDFINAAICTIRYLPTNKPFSFTLPRKK
eukprot:TRINITY_DN9989_c0_g1_i1.p1 TRINITY_DN9989_c0_g1~~TRINITY_DN9989_c0_g1_i1.p1  ORF type:complete len:206 (-),score=19.40 TRINITY_DN9989_c0_g1_i1:44-661(-)